MGSALLSRKPVLGAIVATAATVNHEKFVTLFQNEQRMMPKVALVIDTLMTFGFKSLQIFWPDTAADGCDDDEIWFVLQRYESL